MLGHKIAMLLIKRIKISGLNSSTMQKGNFTGKATIKSFLVDQTEFHSYEIQNNSRFTIEVNKEDYCEALITDFYKCSVRIQEQKKNIEGLIASNAQVAWVLVSMYYCCFFIANEVSKLYGEYIINLSKTDMSFILSMTDYSNEAFLDSEVQSYNSFKVEVAQSDYDDLLLLKLTKSSPKPHSIVWSNLNKIIRKMKIKENDSLFHYHSLLIAVLSKERGWDLPSTIRNNWNYSYAELYGEKGSRLGEKFLKNANNSTATFSWANNRRIKPHDENKVASIAYLYHILIEAYNEFFKFLEVERMT